MMLRITILCASLLAWNTTSADELSHKAMKQQAKAFMTQYLGVYNRRFGHPERSQQFRKELGELVNMPVMQSPPIGNPVVPGSIESFTKNFEGFVSQLESIGVTRLQWAKTEFKVLSKNKILANNVGQGITADGKTAYTTISLYLLHRTDDGWRISMFSPYSIENAGSIIGETWDLDKK